MNNVIVLRVGRDLIPLTVDLLSQSLALGFHVFGFLCHKLACLEVYYLSMTWKVRVSVIDWHSTQAKQRHKIGCFSVIYGVFSCFGVIYNGKLAIISISNTLICFNLFPGKLG
jgi:hypothetical protein